MSDPLALLELLIRGGACGAFLVLALGLITGGATPARTTGALFCLAAAAHTLTQSRLMMEGLALAHTPVWTLSAMGAGLFWAFAIELFSDNRRLTPLRLLPAAGLLLVAYLGVGGPALLRPLSPVFWLAHSLIGVALMGHVLYVVWAGRPGDLVEARQRLRRPLIGIAALYIVAVLVIESIEVVSRPASHLSLLAATCILAMALAGGGVFLRTDGRLFGPQASRATSSQRGAPDPQLLARLEQALARDEVWREERLTIGALASRLGTPEHSLRRLINEGLGHRNFAAFINERRIAAARGALSDPGQARTTVATIAYEVGFGSLGPFNRAFRDATGQTPTAWRRTALAEGQ